MRFFFYLIFFGFLISFSSCRKDFEFKDSSGGLQFSRDTVYLDTVFTNIGSSTYTLKVYNSSDSDINIPLVQLGKGAESKYRMTVDGMTGNNGKIFNNVELLAKDSLYIFIETTANIADTNPTDFLYTDQIQFGAGTTLQTVELVTLIQDAVFLYPQRFDDGTTEFLEADGIPGLSDGDIYGFILDENDPINGNEYIFTNQKPYVIYGYAAVAEGKTLNIQPGARVHFHEGSGIIVAQGGSLKALGLQSETEDLENEIIFEGDRLEPDFSDIPGQWGAIWLTSGSIANEFSNVTILNSTIGLYIQNSDAVISNTKIFDSSVFGIWAQTATITGQNLVINNAGRAALACTLGGSYDFTHCTFNNNWQSSQQVAVLIDNYYEDENGQQVPFDLQQANFTNCIIFGSNQVELLLNKSSIDPATNWSTPQFVKCQIRFNNTANQFTDNPDYAFINDVSNIIKNGDPDFHDIIANKLIIGDESDAIGFGIATSLTNDILGIPRTGPPFDLGAYQHASEE